MDVLRTSDERFADLPEFDFEPHYFEAKASDGTALRIHYLDEGPSDGPVVLLMHGEPTWCYLYRKMVPTLVEAGFRCIVPDLVGFGRSDKPAAQSDYTYSAHVEWITQLFDSLELSDVTLFGQDWGGLVGLRLLAARPDQFARIAVANTGMPTGDQKANEAFLNWQSFAANAEVLPIGRIVAGGCARGLSDDVVAAYEAPFPDPSYQAGAKIFPSLVPTSPDDPASADNRAAWEVLKAWDKPLITLFADSDPITKGGERPFQSLVPGAAGQPHRATENAGHFLQEDAGPELAATLAAWISST